MTERESFLAAIRAQPECDTARLAYADWLDEHGEPERAEFVRVQVELAILRAEEAAILDDETDWRACTGIAATWCPNCGDCCCRNREESMSDDGCPLHAVASPHCCAERVEWNREGVREREAELFRADWLPTVGGQLREWYFECYPADHVPDRPFSFVVARGFVAEVKVTAADWLAHADAILAEHPVARVTLTDMSGWDARIAQFDGHGADGVFFCSGWKGVAFTVPRVTITGAGDPTGAGTSADLTVG